MPNNDEKQQPRLPILGDPQRRWGEEGVRWGEPLPEAPPPPTDDDDEAPS
jgi:hypothetical protein